MKKILYLSLSFEKDIVKHSLLKQFFADLGVYYVSKFPSFPRVFTKSYAVMKQKIMTTSCLIQTSQMA